MDIRSGYMPHIFNPEKLTETVKLATAKIKEIQAKHPFDTLVFTGVSGMSLGFILSHQTGLPVLCLRKRVSDSHSRQKFEGHHGVKRYLLVDDFVDTGATIKRVVRSMRGKFNDSVCAAILLHADTSRNSCIAEGEPAHNITSGLPSSPVFTLDW